MMTELKCYPFCGGQAEYFINSSSASLYNRGWQFRIRCKKCGVETAKKDYKVEATITTYGRIVFVTDERIDAEHDWNRRVDNEAL